MLRIASYSANEDLKYENTTYMFVCNTDCAYQIGLKFIIIIINIITFLNWKLTNKNKSNFTVFNTQLLVEREGS